MSTADKICNYTWRDRIADLLIKTTRFHFSVFISKIYTNELEECAEFEKFEDFVQTFTIRRGKNRTRSDDDSHVVGEFKVNEVLYVFNWKLCYKRGFYRMNNAVFSYCRAHFECIHYPTIQKTPSLPSIYRICHQVIQ